MTVNFLSWDAFMLALWVLTVIGVGVGLLCFGRRLDTFADQLATIRRA